MLIVINWFLELCESAWNTFKTSSFSLNWCINNIWLLENEFLAACVFDCDFSAVEIVPSYSVFYNLGSELVLEVEGNLESLLIHLISSQSDFSACTDADVFDLVCLNQIREVHVNLRYYLFRLEIEYCEPEMLSNKVISIILNTLRENQRSLNCVVIFKSNSLMEDLPSMITFNACIFIICWDLASLVETK